MSIELKTPKQAKQESITFHDHDKYFPFRVMERITETKKGDEVKEKHEFHVVLGNSIVSGKVFKSIKSIDTYIMSKPYELIVNLICDIYQKFKDNETIK